VLLITKGDLLDQER
jgi:putative hydrolase of the HAD superfamily